MSDSFDAFDHACMARALELAARGLYTTDPNPRVGCVIASGGRIVGEGWHRQAGEPHAEAHALAAAGAAARGATAYVTLEPCAHQGRTPPCADALIAAGLARVVYASDDPNPQAARGAVRLRAAGISVTGGLMQAAAGALNPGFLQRWQTGKPWVRAKLAMSLDGRTALADGTSQWITSAAARADVQRLRARSSAVLTGVGTVLRDDPQLTVRAPDIDMRGRLPLRVVLDSSLSLPPTAKLLTTPGPVLVFCVSAIAERRAALAAAGAEIVVLPNADGAVAIRDVLRELGRREVNELLIEAGPKVVGSWLAAQAVDELILYVAPHLLGDTAAALAVLPPLAAMADRYEFEWFDVGRVGADLRLMLRPRLRAEVTH